jgi:EAL and modified HD-GYP domain-containing signal transduction protein
MEKAKSADDLKLLSSINMVYLARQPIFDRQQKVVGYELLFRTGFNNFCGALCDEDRASSKTMLNGFITFGLDLLTGGKPAFINFTANLILDEAAIIFPRELITIEILENVAPSVDIIEACKKMKKHGYVIALDDFEYAPELQPLVDLADIIKVDFRLTDKAARKRLMTKIENGHLKFLAEKVETQEEYAEALEMGFSYFQGYFFSRPKIMQRQEIPGYKMNYLQALNEINTPDADFELLEHIVKRDMSMTYKLLRFINSAAFGFHVKIQSIRQALTLLGLTEFKKWASLVALSGLGEDKPEELLLNSMLRAKFCEFLASKVDMKDSTPDLFLLGMFSNIDAFIDRPIEEISEELPLSDDFRRALRGEKSRFRNVLDMVIAYERADWDEWSRLLNYFKISGEDFPEIYVRSVDWVNKIFK